jgi:hypothetical protein
MSALSRSGNHSDKSLYHTKTMKNADINPGMGADLASKNGKI